MIANPHSRAVLQAEWQGVVRMRERMDHLVVSTFAFDPITSPIFANIFYNLPLLLAVDVLKQVLLQMNKEEGVTTSSPRELDDLMETAKASIPWLDWPCLREAVRRRNQVTHDGKLFGDVQCQQDIADIKAQLIAWGVIPAV
jgi:hypothetical protein